MNNSEREDWIRNDEGLYSWWKGSRQPIRTFIRDNREAIDEVIENVTSGKKPQSYLKYGG